MAWVRDQSNGLFALIVLLLEAGAVGGGGPMTSHDSPGSTVNDPPFTDQYTAVLAKYNVQPVYPLIIPDSSEFRNVPSGSNTPLGKDGMLCDEFRHTRSDGSSAR